MNDRMPVVWSPTTRLHDPRHEVWLGVSTPAVEVAARVDTILAAVGEREIVEADTHAPDALATVHDPGLLEFLATAHERWLEGGYAAEVGQHRVVPYFFPTPALTGGMAVRDPAALHGLTGRFCYDTMTLVGPGTWEAAVAAADCALTAAALVEAGSRAAYALCRPPGHHATRAGYGGSCYLNSAAVAAQAMREAGRRRVAVLDLDAHHGNGTQSIFWERGDVRYGSLHVDPAAGWFPHVLGHADETGGGDGSGATLNLPLAPGTGDDGWLASVAELVDWVGEWDCDGLVVSLGVDAAVDDPESPLAVTRDGYAEAGRRLGGLGVASVVVQEGGYHLPTLGGLVAAYLDGHDAGTSGRLGA